MFMFWFFVEFGKPWSAVRCGFLLVLVLQRLSMGVCWCLSSELCPYSQVFRNEEVVCPLSSSAIIFITYTGINSRIIQSISLLLIQSAFEKSNWIVCLVNLPRAHLLCRPVTKFFFISQVPLLIYPSRSIVPLILRFPVSIGASYWLFIIWVVAAYPLSPFSLNISRPSVHSRFLAPEFTLILTNLAAVRSFSDKYYFTYMFAGLFTLGRYKDADICGENIN